MEDEARHNVALSVIRYLVEEPGIYPEFHLWTVEKAGRTVLAGFNTPPFNIGMSRSAADGALEALAAAAAEDGLRPPGASGAVPEVDAFARAWSSTTGEIATPRMSQRLYRLTHVQPVPPASGSMRPAGPPDRDLVLAWYAAFGAETFPDFEDEPGRLERIFDRRMALEDPGLYLWEDGEPVALVGAGGQTPNGVRIGPVYTPPERRRRGYATALTAAVTVHQLGAGKTFCFLYTDLANPTSNAIYQRIGYEPVCDAVDYRFTRAAG